MAKRESETGSSNVFKLGRKFYQVAFENGNFLVRENGKVVESTYASGKLGPARQYDWKRDERIYL